MNGKDRETVARMAGNIAGGMYTANGFFEHWTQSEIAVESVVTARDILRIIDALIAASKENS